MQILFIDESGKTTSLTDKEISPFFVLGGVIIPEEFWGKVKADLEIIKKRFNILGEIKWRYFAPRTVRMKEHSLSHLTGEEKELLRTQLFSILRKYRSIKTLCVITHIEKAYNLPEIKNSVDLYWYSYKQIIERFHYYLQDISRISGHQTNGIIVCDHRAPNEDKLLQELHAKLLLEGVKGGVDYSSLIEGVFIAPSHLSVGIQFADLVAGAALRFFKSNDTRFFDQIVDTLIKSEKGEVEGYGLIHFPKI